MLENDKTNACTFLAIRIGDAVLDTFSKAEINPSPENMAKLAEEIIISLPSKNQQSTRFIEKVQPVGSKPNELLATNYDLSEECI